MNDFTKEELESLHKFSIRCSDRFNPNDTDLLCLKIQSMIDNYCEHKWTNKSIGITVAPSWPDECVKCGKVRV